MMYGMPCEVSHSRAGSGTMKQRPRNATTLARCIRPSMARRRASRVLNCIFANFKYRNKVTCAPCRVKRDSNRWARRPTATPLPRAPVFSQMLVREVQEVLPVLLGHGVFAGADEIAEVAIDQGVEGGQGGGGEALDTEETIDLVGGAEHVEGAFGIGPGVLDGRAEQDG